MKDIALVLMFAALAATAAEAQQTTKTPREELAKVIAVEEQERDLAKAETQYREALAGKELSAAARVLANQRLGNLLKKLGRDAEAAPFLQAGGADKGAVVTLDDVTQGVVQDVEREKALREKARALVAQVVGDLGMKGLEMDGSPGRLFGIDPPIAEQLLWIGQGAVPEVIAALDEIREPATGFHPDVLRSLGAFLWRVGGPKAEAFLRQEIDQTKGKVKLRDWLAAAACAAERPEMLAVAEQYVRIPDADLTQQLLDGFQWGPPLKHRLDPAVLIDVLGRGSVPQRTWLLHWAASTTRVSGDTLTKLLAIVRSALASTEPELGTAAQKLLLSAGYIQDSIEGTELLLEWLPSSLLGGGPPPPRTQSTLDATQAARLLPKLDACVRAIGPIQRSDPRVNWLEQRMFEVAQPLDASIVPTLLQWTDLGYRAWWGCQGKITAGNAADVFARFDRVRDTDRSNFLVILAKGDLPAELFPSLRAKADEITARGLTSEFAKTMARTGNPDAAAWLLDQWQLPGSQIASYLEAALIELGRRSRDERVRTAMRTMVVKPTTDSRARMVLALLAMGDEPALRLVGRRESSVQHPYATVKTPSEVRRVSPLSYLLYENPDPPHGFGIAPIIAMLQSWKPTVSVSDIDPWMSDPCSDETLVALAEVVFGSVSHTNEGQSRSWQGEVVRRLRTRGDQGPLRTWVERSLAAGGPIAVCILNELNASEVERWASLIEPMLAKDEIAANAAEALLRAKRPLDVPAMLAGKSQLKYWALCKVVAGELQAEDAALLPFLRESGGLRGSVAALMGQRVSMTAVPDLIAMLKDPEADVRTAAAEALTKIRFYHEQQAHWDRVTKGLDASPASAAEKLLLQAKPGAAKAQRLLAIQSLGTLGVPEALPFLIDWTQDADGDIAKAAKDAITQIHLNPRK
jgi:hypothetical protein